MSRAGMLKLAASIKKIGSIDTLIRYNPFVGNRVYKALENYRTTLDFTKYQHLLLDSILAQARKTPYGSEFGNAIDKWPVLEKELIRDNPNKFLNPASFIKIPASTGGTTGVPLEIWRSLECVKAEQIFLDDLLLKHGHSMNKSKLAILRADTFKPISSTTPPFGFESHSGKRLTLSSYHLNTQTVKWFYDALKKFSPSILWVYPNAALNLMDLLLKENLNLRIPIIMASSEALSGQAHVALGHFFQSKVINYYGQAERVCFAVSEKANEFYFNPSYGFVEFERFQEDDEGVSFKIIGTGFWNSAMPLVRYNTGDLLYLPTDSSSNDLRDIVLGKKPFTGLSGRVGEFLLTEEGVRIVGLNHIPREVKNVAKIQLIQVGFDKLFVDVLALPGFSDSDSKQILDQAKAKVPKNMEITVRIVNNLRTTQRGKTPYVIRDI